MKTGRGDKSAVGQLKRVAVSVNADELEGLMKKVSETMYSKSEKRGMNQESR